MQRDSKHTHTHTQTYEKRGESTEKFNTNFRGLLYSPNIQISVVVLKSYNASGIIGFNDSVVSTSVANMVLAANGIESLSRIIEYQQVVFVAV